MYFRLTQLALICYFALAGSIACSYGQTDSVALSSGSTTPGGTVSLQFTLTSATGSSPAGLQWIFNYTPADIASISVTAGPAAVAAGKSIACNGGSGSDMCLLTGINSSVMLNGVVALATVTLSPSVTTSTVISVKNALAVSPTGSAITVTAIGGTITVSSTAVTISALTCNPSSIVTPGSSSCTVTLNRVALSATTVSLSSNNGVLTVPRSLSIAAGASGGTFSAGASSVASIQNGTITATLGTSSQSTLLTLVPVAAISSVSCTPGTLKFGGASKCTVSLNRAVAQARSLLVSTSNNAALSVPPSVTIGAGAQQASFRATAGSVAGTFGIMIGSGTIAKQTSITVTGAQAPKTSPKLLSSLGCSAADASGKSSGFCTQNGPDAAEPRLEALACSPRAITAGDKVKCQVRLRPSASLATSVLPIGADSGDIQVPVTVITRPRQSTLTFEADTNPAANQQSVIVHAGTGQNAVQDSVIVVPSKGPVLTTAGKQALVVGKANRFTVSAVDPDGGPVLLSASRLPANASFDAGSGLFSWAPSQKQVGAYDVTFTALNSRHISSSASVRMEVTSGDPAITSFVNGAGLSPASACSPGGIASLLGTWLSPSDVAVDEPTGKSMELAGASLSINGQPTPILHSSSRRIDFLCPQLRPGEQLQVKLQGSGTASTNSTMEEASPGIFAVDGSGQGQGVIRLQGGPYLAVVRNPRFAGMPAQPGDEIAIRVTGVPATAAVNIQVGSVRVPAESITQVDGFAGVAEVLLKLPGGVPFGEAVPLSLQITESGGAVAESNTVTMAIEPVQP